MAGFFLIGIRVRTSAPSKYSIGSLSECASVAYQTFVKTKSTAFSVFIEDIRGLLHDVLQSHSSKDENNRMSG